MKYKIICFLSLMVFNASAYCDMTVQGLDLTDTFSKFENNCEGQGIENFENGVLNFRLTKYGDKISFPRSTVSEAYRNYIGRRFVVQGSSEDNMSRGLDGEQGDNWSNFHFQMKNSYYHNIPIKEIILSRHTKDNMSGGNFETVVFNMPLAQVKQKLKNTQVIYGENKVVTLMKNSKKYQNTSVMFCQW